MAFDTTLRDDYSDLWDEDDEELVRLLRHLDAGYRAVDRGAIPVPPRLRSLPRDRFGHPAVARPGLAHPRPRRFRRYAPRFGIGAVAAMTVIITLILSMAVASDNILNLGKPTSNISSNYRFPLSGFHRVNLNLRTHGLPELLWIGTAWPGDPGSDMERWPVVKALLQFGKFTGVAPGEPACTKPFTSITGGGPVTVKYCSLATFDWSQARYSSKYVGFVHRDLIDAKGHLFERLTPGEGKIFDRYLRLANGGGVLQIGKSIDASEQLSYVSATPKQLSHQFPLIGVGGYLQTISQTLFRLDFAGSEYYDASPTRPKNQLTAVYFFQPLSFDQTRGALASGKTPSVPGPSNYPVASFPDLVPDVNAEANAITALICHADGKKPSAVCGRPVIKKLLRYVT